jgi:hypothetical protein
MQITLSLNKVLSKVSAFNIDSGNANSIIAQLIILNYKYRIIKMNNLKEKKNKISIISKLNK